MYLAITYAFQWREQFLATPDMLADGPSIETILNRFELPNNAARSGDDAADRVPSLEVREVSREVSIANLCRNADCLNRKDDLV